MRQLAGECVVEAHGPRECFDRLRRLLQIDEAATALLVEAAEARMMPLQGRKRVQGIGDAVQIPLRNGREQEDIPVVRHECEQRFTSAERLCEPLLTEQRAHPRGFRSRHRRG